MGVTNWLSSRYLSLSTPPVTGCPLTMACWFNPGDVTTTCCLMGLGNNGASGFFGLMSAGATGGDPVNAQAQTDAGGGGIASSTAGYTAGSWFHGCAVFASTTSRTAYLNGGNSGNNTTSTTDPTPDFLSIGVLRRSAISSVQPTGTIIAHPAIWNVALSANDVAMLGAGVHPLMVRPDALVWWSPLYDTSAFPEYMGANQLTMTGTLNDAEDGPVWRMNDESWLYVPAATGGAFKAAWARNSNSVIQFGGRSA